MTAVRFARIPRAVAFVTTCFAAQGCSSEADDPAQEALAGAGGSMVVAPMAGSIAAGSGGSTVMTAGSGGISGTGNAGSSGTGVAGTASAGTTGDAGEPNGAGTGGMAGSDDAGTGEPLEKFSFFVTSMRAIIELSGNPEGFGGDLRYGETGEGAGLRGADKICTEIAEQSMPGSGAKGWHAFLSAVEAGPGGTPVHAIDRIGEGPWYDRLGRLFANGKDDLYGFRPPSADPAIVNDLPNEDGVGNHDPDGTGEVDNHDTLTGSNGDGHVYEMDMRVTCNDWTNNVPNSDDAPRVGHSWPRMGFPGGFPGGGGDNNAFFPGGPGEPSDDGGYGHWISSLTEAGCGAGINIIEMGGPIEEDPTVGSGGGYGGFYCFAMEP